MAREQPTIEQPPKIEVLVGMIPQVFWEAEPVSYDYCFALVINGDDNAAIKLKYSGQEPNPDLTLKCESRDSLERSCEAAGREMNGRLREMEARIYALINGQRIKHSTLERITCHQVPKKGLEIFEQYLSAGIKRKTGFDAIEKANPRTA